MTFLELKIGGDQKYLYGKDIEDLRQKLHDQLNIPLKDIRYETSGEGCFIVVFQIPTKYKNQIRKDATQGAQWLKESDIYGLHLEGEQYISIMDAPEAPGKPDVTEVDAIHMVITWTAPKSDGGSPITQYIVERKEKTSTRWMKAHKTKVTDLTLKVEDLIEGKEYEFHVAAINKAGQGPFSEPSEPKLANPSYGVEKDTSTSKDTKTQRKKALIDFIVEGLSVSGLEKDTSPSKDMKTEPKKGLIDDIVDELPFKVIQKLEGASFSELPEVKDVAATVTKPGTYSCHKHCNTCPYVTQDTHLLIEGPTGHHTVTDHFTCNTTNVVFVIICTCCGELFVSRTKRRLADHFTEHLQDVRGNTKSQVACHFNQPNKCSIQNIKVTGAILVDTNENLVTAQRKLCNRLGIRPLLSQY